MRQIDLVPFIEEKIAQISSPNMAKRLAIEVTDAIAIAATKDQNSDKREVMGKSNVELQELFYEAYRSDKLKKMPVLQASLTDFFAKTLNADLSKQLALEVVEKAILAFKKINSDAWICFMNSQFEKTLTKSICKLIYCHDGLTNQAKLQLFLSSKLTVLLLSFFEDHQGSVEVLFKSLFKEIIISTKIDRRKTSYGTLKPEDLITLDWDVRSFNHEMNQFCRIKLTDFIDDLSMLYYLTIKRENNHLDGQSLGRLLQFGATNRDILTKKMTEVLNQAIGSSNLQHLCESDKRNVYRDFSNDLANAIHLEIMLKCHLWFDLERKKTAKSLKEQTIFKTHPPTQSPLVKLNASTNQFGYRS